MKLSEITNFKTLQSISLTGITEEELDKIKDKKELTAYFKRKNKERYNKTHKEYYQSYYQKNREKMTAYSRTYKAEKRLEKTIIKLPIPTNLEN
jgi:hypothetical protein